MSLEVPIPIAIDDIDASWLTEALASRCGNAAAVESFSVEAIGVGVGLMGLLYRVSLQYRDRKADLPDTVIVKLPVLIDATRQVALAYRFYEKEVAFYRELASQTTMNTPEIYFGAHDLTTDNFVLVMEDVGRLRAADQVAGCGRDDARAAVVALARHHASFWEDSRFGTDALAWLPFASDAPTPEGVQQGFDNYWEPFVEFMGDDLVSEVRAVGEWLPGAAQELLSAPQGRPVTLMHGDYRLDNLLFDDERAVTAIDWQITCKGVGGFDFAYFVSQSLTVEGRRAYIDELAEAYLATLGDLGIEYAADDFWADVRRSLLFCLAYPVQAVALDLSDPRAASLVHEMARRASSAIVEVGALDHVTS
jgi:hypothetical protein